MKFLSYSPKQQHFRRSLLFFFYCFCNRSIASRDVRKCNDNGNGNGYYTTDFDSDNKMMERDMYKFTFIVHVVTRIIRILHVRQSDTGFSSNLTTISQWDAVNVYAN